MRVFELDGIRVRPEVPSNRKRRGSESFGATNQRIEAGGRESEEWSSEQRGVRRARTS